MTSFALPAFQRARRIAKLVMLSEFEGAIIGQKPTVLQKKLNSTRSSKMIRTQPLIAVAVSVLLLSAGCFLSGSATIAGSGRASSLPAVAATLVQLADAADAKNLRDNAAATIDRLGGRIKTDAQNNVTELDLSDSQTTDADLKSLKSLTKLTSLRLCRTQVTDAGLEHLTGFVELRSLELHATVISDVGLEHLKGLKKLTFLLLKRTNVTEAGVHKLQKGLPGCLISHSPLNPPPSPKITRLVGKWNVEFANGVQQVCEIRADETASVVEPLRSSGGKVGVQGDALVVAYDDDRVERWTLVGKRLVVEHWASSETAGKWEGHPPFRPLPSARPVLGIAERSP
jgi:hypothetical protein